MPPGCHLLRCRGCGGWWASLPYLVLPGAVDDLLVMLTAMVACCSRGRAGDEGPAAANPAASRPRGRAEAMQLLWMLLQK